MVELSHVRFFDDEPYYSGMRSARDFEVTLHVNRKRR